jgi:hypothetical protein
MEGGRPQPLRRVVRLIHLNKVGALRMFDVLLHILIHYLFPMHGESHSFYGTLPYAGNLGQG